MSRYYYEVKNCMRCGHPVRFKLYTCPATGEAYSRSRFVCQLCETWIAHRRAQDRADTLQEKYNKLLAKRQANDEKKTEP